ncbi:DUF2269 family protein [Halomonas sp. HP20-15]|uniref:DUF2269 family protein n=1 Tax=Halomonas sp. HP20-15 TaxID=3085901 RepID=UPI00298215E4|nr:DUF2269 family protein [Halomonas sp. HP20-15]MDW5375342.1 DUF2269 family protein [Halomonas sp. HP20-15]
MFKGSRFALSSLQRKVVLTVHIIVSVGLLGDSAGFLAVAIRGAAATDPAIAEASYQTLRMFSYVFGIPLSFAGLLTGLLLGLGTNWGVFRYPWVTTKLLLIISVIAVGALVLDGEMDAMLSGSGGAEGKLIAGAAYDVFALAAATFIAVFKPSGRWSSKPAAQ